MGIRDKLLIFGAYTLGVIYGLLALRWIVSCDPCATTVCGTTEFGIFRNPIIFECAIKRFAIAFIPFTVAYFVVIIHNTKKGREVP